MKKLSRGKRRHLLELARGGPFLALELPRYTAAHFTKQGVVAKEVARIEERLARRRRKRLRRLELGEAAPAFTAEEMALVRARKGAKP